MQNDITKIAIIAEHFDLGSPAQQLLDRFLIGYPRDGEFRRIPNCRVVACPLASHRDSAVTKRVTDFGLSVATKLSECVDDAAAVVAVPTQPLHDGSLVRSIVESMGSDGRLFVYGTLSKTAEAATNLLGLARSRSISIATGNNVCGAWPLPDTRISPDSTMRRALIVAQGSYPAAEVDALAALLPVLQRRKKGETGVAEVGFYEGSRVWSILDGEMQPLLASALSRSDTPQGDPVADGRTQDIVGLGLVPRLADRPRCWSLRHRDGLHSVVAILNGVVADMNVAVEADAGRVYSWQLYRPPAPAEHHYSRLAGIVEEFFHTGRAVPPLTDGMLLSELLQQFEKQAPKSFEGRIGRASKNGVSPQPHKGRSTSREHAEPPV